MSKHEPETVAKSDAEATTVEQSIERNANEIPAPAAPTVRPWTEDFLLPSISFREPKPGEDQATP